MMREAFDELPERNMIVGFMAALLLWCLLLLGNWMAEALRPAPAVPVSTGEYVLVFATQSTWPRHP